MSEIDGNAKGKSLQSVINSDNGDFCNPMFVDAFADNLRNKAGRKETRMEEALLLRKIASHLERLRRHYFASDLFNPFRHHLGKAIERCDRVNDTLRGDVFTGVLDCWLIGKQPDTQAEAVEPAPCISLGTFLEVLENYRNRMGRSPYRHLPARESVCLMLTGQINLPNTPLRKYAVGWRDCEWQNPSYRLKLFDGAEEVEDKALLGGENLRENLTIMLDNVAPFFLSRHDNYYQCLPLPWCSVEGDLILLEHPEATQACKKEFIPYLKAERYLQNRFQNVTSEEIALWLDNGEITAKSCPYAIAKDIRLHNNWNLYGHVDGKDMQSLEDSLNTLYFSKEELQKVNPTRWKFYEKVKEWAKDHGMEERMLISVIKLNMLEFDYRMEDPVRRSAEEEKAATAEDKIRCALYHPDFFTLIEEEYFDTEESPKDRGEQAKALEAPAIKKISFYEPSLTEKEEHAFMTLTVAENNKAATDQEKGEARGKFLLTRFNVLEQTGELARDRHERMSREETKRKGCNVGISAIKRVLREQRSRLKRSG